MAKLVSKDEFQQWVFDMDDALDAFRQRFPADQRARLDFSPESLDVVEKWILDRYPSTAAMLADGEAETVDQLARYIGETFRKTLGGSWRMRQDDPDYVFHNLPIVVFGGKVGEDSPHSLATATADRRKGTYLSTILRNKQARRQAEGA